MKCAWDTFDRIVCIHCAAHTGRKADLLIELNRVGLIEAAGDRFSFHTTCCTDSDTFIYGRLRESGIDVPQTVGQFKAALAHHEVLKCAMLDGCQSILIIENDIRFLRDVDLVHDIVAPWRGTERDLVMFDRFVYTGRMRPFTYSGRGFTDFDQNVRGGSCYALSRHGIEETVAEFDRRLTSSEHKVYIGDMLYDRTAIRKCFTDEPACVQKEYPDGMNLTVYGTHQYAVYASNGIDLSLYNI